MAQIGFKNNNKFQMEQILDIFKIIDYKLLIIIVISSYWYKKNLSDLKITWLTLGHQILLWSTIVSVAYYFIAHATGLVDKDNWTNYVITYFAATSFYELLWKPLEDYLVKKFSNKSKDA